VYRHRARGTRRLARHRALSVRPARVDWAGARRGAPRHPRRTRVGVRAAYAGSRSDRRRAILFRQERGVVSLENSRGAATFDAPGGPVITWHGPGCW